MGSTAGSSVAIIANVSPSRAEERCRERATRRIGVREPLHKSPQLERRTLVQVIDVRFPDDDLQDAIPVRREPGIRCGVDRDTDTFDPRYRDHVSAPEQSPWQIERRQHDRQQSREGQHVRFAIIE